MLPSAERFSAALVAAGIGDGTRVVLYDAQMNMWAARVWWMLRAYGFDSAAVLDGGWQAWSQEERPVSSGAEPDRPEAVFVARPRPGLFVGKEDVLVALDRPDVAVIDALEPEVYRGERQDYARPGHIPGAYNVPFTAVVDPATHRYQSPDRLRELFAEVLSPAPGQVITYCGAAIAASSDAFALGLIGFDDVAIYDGSMVEWGADPALPLATG
jgi:thiosulfate/3-mercaptopyruvate sulfurtransferase